MQRGGHHLEPQGSRATLSAVRWVALILAISMDIANAKATWRRDMRKRRSQQSPLSTAPAVAALLRCPQWQHALVIASYSPLNSEQSPSLIDSAATRAGKRLVYPRVLADGTMVFKAPGAGDGFVKDDHGVPAPPEKAETVDASDIDLFIVPLLACDDTGIRLGYGGGYYDRQLSLSAGFRCGLGYGMQRVSELPAEAHDARLHGFLSEHGLEYFEW